MTATTPWEKIGRVGVHEMRPGDVLVLHVEQWLSEDERNSLRDDLRRAFGVDHMVVVLENGASLEVVRPS